jgi:DNA-binding NtrC family response regulator
MSSIEVASRAPASGSGRSSAFALRQIVTRAVTRAEVEAIRHALGLTHGNKSQAARLLRTNYTTLHAKMRRHGISAQEFYAGA